MPTIGTITLTVTQFVQNNCCTATASVSPPDSAGGRLYQKAGDQNVYIKSKGKAQLIVQFKVVCPPPPAAQDTYTVTNASLKFSGAFSDTDGSKTFTNPTVDPASPNIVSVNNTFAAQPQWTYTVVIKNSAGQSGTIDPGIINTDEN